MTRVKRSKIRGKKPGSGKKARPSKPGRKTGTPAAGHGNYKTMPAKKLKKAAKKTIGKAKSKVARKRSTPTKAAKKTIGKAMSRFARTRSR